MIHMKPREPHYMRTVTMPTALTEVFYDATNVGENKYEVVLRSDGHTSVPVSAGTISFVESLSFLNVTESSSARGFTPGGKIPDRDAQIAALGSKHYKAAAELYGYKFGWLGQAKPTISSRVRKLILP